MVGFRLHIKNPSKLQNEAQREMKAWEHSPPNLVFLFGGLVLPVLYKRTEPTNCEILSTHLFIGSAAQASGSLMTVTCKFATSINVSCLHFGQYRG